MYSRYLRHFIFVEVSGGKKKENWQGEVTEEFLLITNRSPYNNGGRIIISSTNGFFKAQHLKTQGGGSVQTPSLILATSLSFGDVLISFNGLQFMLIMLLWQNSPEMPSKNREVGMRSIHLKKGFLIASNIACEHSTLSTI